MSGAPYVRRFRLYFFSLQSEKNPYFSLSFALSEYERRTLIMDRYSDGFCRIQHLSIHNCRERLGMGYIFLTKFLKIILRKLVS
jgi:hypothetical protein